MKMKKGYLLKVTCRVVRICRQKPIADINKERSHHGRRQRRTRSMNSGYDNRWSFAVGLNVALAAAAALLSRKDYATPFFANARWAFARLR